jgi:magnesium transporter
MIFGKKEKLPPGDPVYVGDRPAMEMELSIITYDSSQAQIQHLSNIDELAQYKNKSKISWINISGLKDIESI